MNIRKKDILFIPFRYVFRIISPHHYTFSIKNCTIKSPFTGFPAKFVSRICIHAPSIIFSGKFLPPRHLKPPFEAMSRKILSNAVNKPLLQLPCEPDFTKNFVSLSILHDFFQIFKNFLKQMQRFFRY